MASLHTFLVGLTARAIHLLPRGMHGALDAWSRRVAHDRAVQRQQRQQRQRAIRPKG